MRSAKTKFIESPFRQPFEAIAVKVEFEEALYAALLQFQSELPDPLLPQGLDSASRFAGARRYMEILANLHLKEQEPKIQRLPSLTHPSMRKD